MWCPVFMLLLLICNAISQEVESRLITTAQGPIRGYKNPENDIFIFYNIPYATAPTGPEKFKAPLPGPTWSEPFDAVDKGVICPQPDVYGLIPDNKTMTEDCLIANVYTPDTNETNLPVLVYVHGGGFIGGFGSLSEPKKLVNSKRVVAVTFNYRLAAHGFLCLGTTDIPGNGGLKDQVALLRWVKANIRNFGGNANDVTIAGYSAGSSSVFLLMVSKMARGLFNKVIAESGDMTAPFSVQINPRQNVEEYTKLLGYDSYKNINDLERFYKNISYEILNSADIGFEYNTALLVTPCVEKDVGQEMFLEESPLTALENADFENFPILVGFTNMEGLLRIEVFDEWSEKMNTNFELFLPPDLQFTKDQRDDVVKDIKKFYFNDEPIDRSNALGYVYYLTDVLIACPVLRTVNLLLKGGHDNIFLFEYSYVDNSSPVSTWAPNGADHCAESYTVLDGINVTFPNNENNISKNYQDWKILMRNVWLNFVTTGKPQSPMIPEWLPVIANATPYMSLKQNPDMQESLLKERCGFWQEIYDQHYQSPVPPSWS